jgi:hypothetical protein
MSSAALSAKTAPAPASVTAKDGLYSYVLALYAAGLGFTGFLSTRPGLDPLNKLLWDEYVRGWLWAFFAAVFAGLFWPALRRMKAKGSPSFYPVLLLGHHLTLLAACWRPLGTELWNAYAIKVGVAGVLVSAVLALRVKLDEGKLLEKAELLALGAAPLLALRLLAWFQGPLPYGLLIQAALAAGLVGVWVSRDLAQGPAARRTALGSLAVLLMIAYLLFPWRPTYNIDHQCYYLGPVNSVLHGRSMLVDIRCQYGVGIIYTMAGLFKALALPPSFYGLTVLTCFSYIIQSFLLWFFVLRRMRFRALEVTLLIALIAINRYGYWGDMWDPVDFPSVGPWRFFPPLLVVIAADWRSRRPGRSRIPELTFMAVASTWSLEAFAYGFSGLLAYWVFDAWTRLQGFRARVGDVLRRVPSLLLAVGLAQGILALGTRAQSGQWPDYDLYMRFFGSYGSGLSFHGMDVSTPWFLLSSLPLVCLLGCLWLFFKGERRPLLPLAAAFCILGAMEFSYYIMRAHPSNLRYVSVAPLLGFFLLLDMGASLPSLPASFRRSAVWAGAFTAFVAVVAAWPTLKTFLPQDGFKPRVANAVGWAASWDQLKHPQAITERGAWIRDLVNRNMPEQDQVAVIAYGDHATEGLLLLGKVDTGPVANSRQDEIQGMDVAVMDRGLKVGDKIIFTKAHELLNPLQHDRYLDISKRFGIEYLDCIYELCAVRLTEPPASPPAPAAPKR